MYLNLFILTFLYPISEPIKEIMEYLIAIYIRVEYKKKLDPRWLDSPGYSGLRRSSHADRENQRIPTPPIHNGTVAP
jgi:hypothetical protein